MEQQSRRREEAMEQVPNDSINSHMNSGDNNVDNLDALDSESSSDEVEEEEEDEDHEDFEVKEAVGFSLNEPLPVMNDLEFIANFAVDIPFSLSNAREKSVNVTVGNYEESSGEEIDSDEDDDNESDDDKENNNQERMKQEDKPGRSNLLEEKSAEFVESDASDTSSDTSEEELVVRRYTNMHGSHSKQAYIDLEAELADDEISVYAGGNTKYHFYICTTYR
jgi:hypothetical protein